LGHCDDLRQRRPAGGAEALEAGKLRLDRDAGGAGALDQVAAVRENRGPRLFGGGGAGTCRRLPLPGQLGRVGVETKADLAAALVY